jgi:hypothetical protein
VHDTHELDVDQPTPILQPLLPHGRLLTHHTRVVADEVDAAEPFDGLVGERVHIGVHTDNSAGLP